MLVSDTRNERGNYDAVIRRQGPVAQQTSVAPMHFAKALKSGFEEREDGVSSSINGDSDPNSA